MDRSVTISVVIPVKNGRATLEDCLKGIRMQTVYAECEIVVVDSGSTDGTLEFLKSQNDVRLFQIPPANFNHGLTRNYGVSLARGKFVVMTVQDATAADDQWLEKMRSHFNESQVAAVCGQQVVPHHPDKNPHEWFRLVGASGILRVGYASAEEFESLSPEQKKNVCSWDDVNAMYRAEVLQKIPFREAFFGEDAMWAKDALLAGWVLIYDTGAQVYHYHFQTFDYTYKRVLTQLYFGYKIFGYVRENTGNFREYLKIIYRNFKYGAELKWIWHTFEAINGRNKAFRDFHKSLAKGDASLEVFYYNTCKVPPQGRVDK